MTNILAIDTSTDACSVAIFLDGRYSELHEMAPRQHSQRLFSMLRDLLPGGDLRAQGIDAIAYANGPGSFTGLRIAASAVQGLAFANSLPAIPVSTLACQAQTASRKGILKTGDTALSMLDARMNEVYWGLFDFQDSLVRSVRGPLVCSPQAVAFDPPMRGLKGIGGGFCYIDSLPSAIVSMLESVSPDLLPSARDLIPLAISDYELGNVQQALEVAPVYVREEITWKKISEQGKRQ